MTTLTGDQSAVAKQFLRFLLTDDKYFCISGTGGVGKTFLMGYLSNEIMHQYEDACALIDETPIYTSVDFTATTNKAAEVLEKSTNKPVSTIHSYLGLKVYDNTANGLQEIRRTSAYRKHRNCILFIDECSMIDTGLFAEILEAMEDSKVVFVGDHAQMAPIEGELSPIYSTVSAENFAQLTQQVRNADSPALMQLCTGLRNTVETGVFENFDEVPGSIEFLNHDQLTNKLNQVFFDPQPNARILCYTNQRVMDYNKFIRNLKGLPTKYVTGEILVAGSSYYNGDLRLNVERQVVVRGHSHKEQCFGKFGPKNKPLMYYELEIEIPFSSGKTQSVKVAANKDHFKECLSFLARSKHWSEYFTLKNAFIDLRNVEASTVYKAQGSTYDEVFIDLGNIGTSRDPEQVARMLFVGASRARNKVYFYGRLPSHLLRKDAA